MRRFYCPAKNTNETQAILDRNETKHLRDVLRLGAGDEVSVFDGEGREFSCLIETIGKNDTKLKIVSEITPKSPESGLDLTLAVALLKGEKFDLIVQKAVELGVSKIVPLQTKRADLKIKDERESEKKLDRWQKIALEASKQSGRAKLMTIDPPVDFKEFVKVEDGVKIVFSERGGSRFSKIGGFGEIIAVIGPEGGWDDTEIELANENGFQIVTLGGRILRAETAVIAVSALLQNHFGDLN